MRHNTRVRSLALILVLALSCAPSHAPVPDAGNANGNGNGNGNANGSGNGNANGSGGDGGAKRPAAGGVLLGDVFDPRGWPIAGATVRLVGGPPSAIAPAAELRLEPAGELGVLRGPVPYPPRDPFVSPLLPSGLTDGRGRFRLADLPAGRLVVIASHPDFADGRSEEVLLAPGGEARVQIALKPAPVVRGRVVDERGPVGGAELWRAGELAAVADGAGRFELRRLADPVEVEARARGYVPAKRVVDPAVDHEIEYRLAHAGGRLAGVVVDERGFPVAGARAAVGGGRFHAEAVSDKRGEFAVDGAPEGPLALRVSHDEHPTAALTVAAGDDVRVALAPGAGVEGELRDERTGAPPPGGRVTVESGGERRTAAIDRRGRFRVIGLAPGAATLTANAPGYLAASQSINLPAAEWSREVTVRDLRVDLTLGGAVVGVVRDDRGEPARDVEVTVGALKLRSDAQGRFHAPAVPAGRVEVTAGNASESITVDPGRDTRVELRLR